MKTNDVLGGAGASFNGDPDPNEFLQLNCSPEQMREEMARVIRGQIGAGKMSVIHSRDASTDGARRMNLAAIEALEDATSLFFVVNNNIYVRVPGQEFAGGGYLREGVGFAQTTDLVNRLTGEEKAGFAASKPEVRQMAQVQLPNLR